MKKKIAKTMPAATTSFVDVSSENVGTIIDHARTLITDLMPILQVIIAVAIGVIIITAIINAIRG